MQQRPARVTWALRLVDHGTQHLKVGSIRDSSYAPFNSAKTSADDPVVVEELENVLKCGDVLTNHTVV